MAEKPKLRVEKGCKQPSPLCDLNKYQCLGSNKKNKPIRFIQAACGYENVAKKWLPRSRCATLSLENSDLLFSALVPLLVFGLGGWMCSVSGLLF